MKTKKVIKKFLLDKSRTKLLRDKYIFLLIMLSLVLLASTVRFGMRTYKIPEWDEQHYMRMATEFYRLIKDPSFETPYKMLQVVPFRQPGYPLLILPFLLIFGLSNSYFWGIFTNGLLYIVSIFGIFFIARNFMSKQASFMASVIFAFYGWTLLHLDLTYSETATSAFIILTILFLIESNFFQIKKYSILFGIFLGLGLLVKWITAVFVLGPLIYVLYQILKKRLFKRKKTIKYLGLAFIIALVISIYPYLQNNYWIFQYFYGHRAGGPMWLIVPEQERNPISVYSLTFYLNSFAQLGIFPSLLIIFGFVLALKRKSNLKPILFTVIISYLFSAFALLKAERHIIPIYPYLAILSASVFDYIRNIRLKISIIIFILILSIFSFLGSVWGRGPMKKSLYSLPIELPFGQLRKIYLTTFSRQPYIYKISGREVLDFIEKDSKKNGIVDPQITSLFYFRPLDEPLMSYNLYNLEKPLAINNFVGTVIGNSDKETNYIIQVAFKNADYVLIKTGKKVDDYFSEINYRTLKTLIVLFDNSDIKKHFSKEAVFWINQDSSEVTVLKKKREMSKEELEGVRLRFSEILKTIK